MVKLGDVYFKIGSFQTFEYVFYINKVKKFETIYCEIVSVLKTDSSGNQKEVLVKQIHNLEDYLKGNKEFDYSNRKLNVDAILPIFN